MIWRVFSLCRLGWPVLAGNPAGAAGPFTYRLPGSPGGDPAAITVVGQPQTHHIVRYENLYKIARDPGSPSTLPGQRLGPGMA